MDEFVFDEEFIENIKKKSRSILYRKWREKNPEKTREKARKWRENSPERSRESVRKYREKNPEKARESVRKWRENNPEKARESVRKWRENNPEKTRELNRKSYLKYKAKLQQPQSINLISICEKNG